MKFDPDQAIADHALAVLQDPTSSPEERDRATEALVHPGRSTFKITEDMAYALTGEEREFLINIYRRWMPPENIVIPAAAPPPTLEERGKAAGEAFAAFQLAARAEGAEIERHRHVSSVQPGHG